MKWSKQVQFYLKLWHGAAHEALKLNSISWKFFFLTMQGLHKMYLLIVLPAILLKSLASGHTFCIRNNTQEIENEHNLCDISATVFTPKEKDIFYRTLCKDHVKNIKGDYSFLKIRDGVLKGHQSYKILCQEQQSSSVLGWVPWQTVKEKIMNKLNKTEINFYIAKATNKEKSNTELCFFSETSMKANNDDASCQLIIFQDDFFGPDSDINVLVEILPLFYEIRNISYEPWTKIKHSYKTVLGKSVLQNPSIEKKTVYGNIDYNFIEKIKLHTSAIANGILEKFPVRFEKEDIDMLFVNGSGDIEIREKTYFGRLLDPKSSIKVELIGQWSEHHREFRGDLYENYGQGIRLYKESLQPTKISFTKISNIEPVYENQNIIQATKMNVITLERLTQGGLVQNITIIGSTMNPAKKTWNHPYPEFFPYFLIGCLVVGLGLFIPVGNMILILKREGKF